MFAVEEDKIEIGIVHPVMRSILHQYERKRQFSRPNFVFFLHVWSAVMGRVPQVSEFKCHKSAAELKGTTSDAVRIYSHPTDAESPEIRAIRHFIQQCGFRCDKPIQPSRDEWQHDAQEYVFFIEFIPFTKKDLVDEFRRAFITVPYYSPSKQLHVCLDDFEIVTIGSKITPDVCSHILNEREWSERGPQVNIENAKRLHISQCLRLPVSPKERADETKKLLNEERSKWEELVKTRGPNRDALKAAWIIHPYFGRLSTEHYRNINEFQWMTAFGDEERKRFDLMGIKMADDLMYGKHPGLFTVSLVQELRSRYVEQTERYKRVNLALDSFSLPPDQLTPGEIFKMLSCPPQPMLRNGLEPMRTSEGATQMIISTKFYRLVRLFVADKLRDDKLRKGNVAAIRAEHKDESPKKAPKKSAKTSTAKRGTKGPNSYMTGSRGGTGSDTLTFDIQLQNDDASGKISSTSFIVNSSCARTGGGQDVWLGIVDAVGPVAEFFARHHAGKTFFSLVEDTLKTDPIICPYFNNPQQTLLIKPVRIFYMGAYFLSMLSHVAGLPLSHVLEPSWETDAELSGKLGEMVKKQFITIPPEVFKTYPPIPEKVMPLVTETTSPTAVTPSPGSVSITPLASVAARGPAAPPLVPPMRPPGMVMHAGGSGSPSSVFLPDIELKRAMSGTAINMTLHPSQSGGGIGIMTGGGPMMTMSHVGPNVMAGPTVMNSGYGGPSSYTAENAGGSMDSREDDD